MAIQTNFPAVKPSLLLDFANTKKLDPRITFTRTTTATYYDGVTTAKAEENLLTYSQEFDNANWAKTNVTVTANSTTAPDGTSTAETFDDDTANAAHDVSQTIVTTSGSTYTLSAFLKNVDRQYAILACSGSTTSYASAKFDLSAGTLGSTAASGAGWSVTSSSITSVGSSWYRCSITFVVGTTTGNTARIGMATDGTTFTASQRGLEVYTGSDKTIYVWGAQLEQRSSVTAYTATTTQPITNYIPVLLTAASGVARFQHNPTTYESLGLLIEEARTNLATYSADFSNAAWLKTAASITSDTIVAPDGTLTGDKLVEDTTTSNHFTVKSVAAVTGTTYVMSVFAKQAESNRYLSLTFANGAYYSGEAATFNLSTGVVETTSGTTTATITSVGNGWYRCSVTAVSKVTGTPSGAERILLNNSTSSSSFSYTGNGYSGIYIWGAQLEAGAFATSYIATTSATVTRNADAASMTGGNFTSWFNAGEGTIYFESQSVQGTNSYPYSLFGSSTSNRIFANYSSNSTMTAGIRVNGTFEVSVATPNSSAPINTFGKGALAYKVNDFGFSWNGAAALTDTSTTLPIIQKLDIGNNGGLATNWLSGTIKKIAYYPLRLTNAQLQALTS